MPARYSPVAPLSLLVQLHDRDLLGNYLLLLAHNVLEDPRGYIDLVDSLNIEDFAYPQKRFIIIDNGVIESGKAMPVLDTIEAASLVEADCIVVPDVLGDFQGTQKLIMEQNSHLRNCEFPLMKLPQGGNLVELVQCVNWMRDYLEVPSGDPNYWGVPRWISNKFRTRTTIVRYISARSPDAKIHLLGMSENLDDDMLCTSMQNVIGIDSANPLVVGFAGLSLSDPVENYVHMVRGNYWTLKMLAAQAQNNVRWMHVNIG